MMELRQAPGLTTQRAKPAAKASAGPAVTDSNRLYAAQDILEETKKYFPQLQNENTAKTFLDYLQILDITVHNGDSYVLKDRAFLGGLFTSYARLRDASYDADTKKSIFETTNHGKIHADKGDIRFEAERIRVGKSKKFIPKPFTMDDAYDMAFAALHDRTLLPPNKINIKNASPKERAMIQLALQDVGRQCLPKDMQFKVVRGMNPASLKLMAVRHGITHDIDSVMFRAIDELKEEARIKAKDLADAAPKPQEGKPEKLTPLVTPKSIIGKLSPLDYSASYADLTPEKVLHNKAKSLIAATPETFKDAPIDVLGTKLGITDPAVLKEVVGYLEKDGFIKTATENDTKIITETLTAPNMRSRLYAHVAANMIHKPQNWENKQRKDVIAFIDKYLDKKGRFSKSEKEAVWQQLKDDGVIKTGEKSKKAKIVEVPAAKFAGTNIGAEFANASKQSVIEPKSLKDLATSFIEVGKKNLGQNITAGLDRQLDEINGLNKTFAEQATSRAERQRPKTIRRELGRAMLKAKLNDPTVPIPMEP